MELDRVASMVSRDLLPGNTGLGAEIDNISGNGQPDRRVKGFTGCGHLGLEFIKKIHGKKVVLLLDLPVGIWHPGQ